MDEASPLSGLRVVEFALLAADGVGQHLADLGADIIKVEAVGGGDYVRSISWPMVNGVSLEHLHWNRGKRSIAIDLHTKPGIQVFLDLIRRSDALIEGMRPGALARRGLSAARLAEENPRLVLCRNSGYGSSGPYRNLPSHGLAFDAVAGIAPPSIDDQGRVTIAPHTSIGMHAGPLYAALGLVAAVLRARETGRGCVVEVADSDAAIAWNWLRVEGERAYERPDAEVRGNSHGNPGHRRAIGFDDFGESVRYQYYDSADGHVLLMASEDKFWRNFCNAVDRSDLYERYPGEQIAEHALGNRPLREELAAVFRSRSTGDWVQLAIEHDIPIAPVRDAVALASDPQVRDRIGWLPASSHGADLLKSPIMVDGTHLASPSPAPAPGQHSREVLRSVIGYSQQQADDLIADGIVE